MTTAFTPGPWPTDGIMYGKGVIFNVPGVATNGVFEWRANQKLIAAAPDLYEALDYINAYCVAALDTGTYTAEDFTRIRDTATTALAKARGEQV